MRARSSFLQLPPPCFSTMLFPIQRVESRCDEIKLAAPEAKVLMGMKVEVLIVLEATRSMCMQGGNANVVSLELRVT